LFDIKFILKTVVRQKTGFRHKIYSEDSGST